MKVCGAMHEGSLRARRLSAHAFLALELVNSTVGQEMQFLIGFRDAYIYWRGWSSQYIQLALYESEEMGKASTYQDGVALSSIPAPRVA